MSINKRERKLKLVAITEGIILAAIVTIYLTYSLPSIINYISSFNPKIKEMNDLIIKQDQLLDSLRYDLVRAEDITNILLAIQDFINEKNEIPNSLDYLVNQGYLKTRLRDPETNEPYFFKNEGEKFIFCMYMSDRIRGVNTRECPSKESQPSSFSQHKFLIAQLINNNNSVNPEELRNFLFKTVNYETKRWLFTILWGISILLLIIILYFLIKRLLL